ncbi:MAG TPA: glycosyltransferase [Usitatibacter sp.]|nr:glycosyltransferase [Usitatibacter sp.]
MIDVIIPVYRGADETRRCIESVLRSIQATPHEVVVVDDATPEPGIARHLDALAAERRITLLRNPSNAGFVASVNRGMALHPDRDVVLLNSDTEVANDWLDRLRAAACREGGVATVTPFSNNATICSYPFNGWEGGLPGALGLERLDALFARVHAGRTVDIPTAVGFCMLVRRECLARLGAFDERRFGRGYGEENDFCMRAAKAGYRNVLAADVFVFHQGSVSFAHEKAALGEAAMAALLEVHPDYLDRVHAFLRADPVQPLRGAIDAARSALGPAEAAHVAAERRANPAPPPLPAVQGAGVFSITVAFNPEPARLLEQLEALRGQVEEAILVDNGSMPPIERALDEAAVRGFDRRHVRLVRLSENRGIAGGMNVGIGHARGSGAGHVLLLDHDSVPAAGMVERLVEGHRKAEATPGGAVAAVGPRVHDPRDAGEYPFVRLGWTHNEHRRCAGPGEIVACDFLISSGALVPMAAVDRVGEFDESLFIDNVDLEWCCRARHRGLRLFGVCDAHLDHRLGDARRPVLGGFGLVVHSPERLYYMTRNRFMLYRRAYMPLKWKWKDLLRALFKFAATMLVAGNRREYARMTAAALRDAWHDRGGPLR